jgi:4-hydroxymandelate oxidase
MEFEPLARERVPVVEWVFISGGAEDEVTMGENRAAFERVFLRPRYLVDVSKRDLSTTVLGTKIPMPLILAPTAYQCMSHPDGEVATAQGAGATGTLMILSTLATKTMEEVTAAASGPMWYQIYMMQDMEFNEWAVRRAEKCGFQALVLTVDVVVAANRERDRKNGLTYAGVDVRNMLVQSEDAPECVRKVKHFMELPWKADLSWKDVEWLRSKSTLPIVVKGLLSVEDAQMAVDHGAAGIVVSNHGGRQLDGAPATLDVLPEMADAVGDKVELYLDSGVRRGADILKAVALGARAACIGRPYVWGLGADGARGVQRVIEVLRYELDTAMALTGKRTMAEVDRSLVWRR